MTMTLTAAEGRVKKAAAEYHDSIQRLNDSQGSWKDLEKDADEAFVHLEQEVRRFSVIAAMRPDQPAAMTRAGNLIQMVRNLKDHCREPWRI